MSSAKAQCSASANSDQNLFRLNNKRILRCLQIFLLRSRSDCADDVWGDVLVVTLWPPHETGELNTSFKIFKKKKKKSRLKQNVLRYIFACYDAFFLKIKKKKKKERKEIMFIAFVV